jgi:hypothetical protein
LHYVIKLVDITVFLEYEGTALRRIGKKTFCVVHQTVLHTFLK